MVGFEAYAFLNITPLVFKNNNEPSTATIMNPTSSQNPIVVQSVGGNPLRVIVIGRDEVTETEEVVVVVVTAVSQ
jgi:hypothetical protein